MTIRTTGKLIGWLWNQMTPRRTTPPPQAHHVATCEDYGCCREHTFKMLRIHGKRITT